MGTLRTRIKAKVPGIQLTFVAALRELTVSCHLFPTLHGVVLRIFRDISAWEITAQAPWEWVGEDRYNDGYRVNGKG